MSQDDSLATLLAEREILRTLTRYSHAIDNKLEDEWIECFTEDGTYEVHTGLDSGAVKVNNGREALKQYAAARSERERGDTHRTAERHLMLLPLIEVSGDEAMVNSYFIWAYADDGDPGVGSIGRYRDHFVKCDDGHWRIKHRTFTGEATRQRDRTTA